MISGLPGVPETFSKVTAIFRITQRHCRFHCADICTDGAKAIVGKAEPLTQIKAVAPNCTNNHCIFTVMYSYLY